MFKLRILSLFFLLAFAGSKAFKQESIIDNHNQINNHDHGDIKILLKDDGEVDLKIPEHDDYYLYDDEQDYESEHAPLLMKRGKGGKRRWGRKGGYGGGKGWRKYNKYNNGYNGYNNYNGPNGPGWNNGYDNW